MTEARNISDVQRLPDGGYFCTVELFDDWTKSWEEVVYCARPGDPAPVNKWILSELETGVYDIVDYVEPPQPVQAAPNVIA